MIAASLFSGIGAPEVAMPEWSWIWHAEIDPFASAVFAARHPHSLNLGDVTRDDFCDYARGIGRPTVLVFGSPCQSFSVAGRRRGLDDPRGDLALTALRIVERVRPDWFVFENVPGLLSSDDGRDFGIFLRSMDELGAACCWSVLDAQYFGLAQRRKRVFAVGRLDGDWRRCAAVLLEPDRLCGDSPTRGEARQDVTGTLGSRTTAGGGLGTDFDLAGGVMAYGGGNTSGPIAAAAAVNAKATQRMDFETETLIATFDPTQITHAANRSQPQAERCHTLPAEGYAPVAFDWQSGGTKQRISTSERTSAPCRGQTPAVFALHENQRAELTLNDTAGSLKVGGGKPGQGYPAVLSTGVRRLTPTECERLQGFPDDYTAVTYRGKPAADGPRYKAIGNSMAVPVVRWVLKRIDWLDHQEIPCLSTSTT